ncbi:hypothetical protein [Micromonospora parastrephiae]|nr:hypothetical protein [Micromonospora parastrephiae]
MVAVGCVRRHERAGDERAELPVDGLVERIVDEVRRERGNLV